MKDFLWGIACVALIGGVVLLGVGKFKAEGQAAYYEQEVGQWKAKYAEASTQVRVDSVEVVRQVTRVVNKRDSLLIRLTDTVAVREYIYQTDTLRQSCLACTESASRLRTFSDSLNRANDSLVRALRPSRWAKVRGPALFVAGLVIGSYVRGGGR